MQNFIFGYHDKQRERYGCPDFAQLHIQNRDERRFMNMGGVLVGDDKTDNEGREDDGYKNIPVIERTITVACFPHDIVGLTASLKHDQISPEPDYEDPVGQMSNFFRLATQPSSRKEQEALFERGCADAEKWCYEETLREKELFEAWIQDKRIEKEIEDAIKRGDLF